VLPAKTAAIRDVIEAVSVALPSAITRGLTELKSSSVAAPMLLGPSDPRIWPRVLGLIARVALHLEHRVPPPVPAFEVAGPNVLPAAQALERCASALTSSLVLEGLEALEALADATDVPEKPTKRGRKTGIPQDLDTLLVLHQRLLEALNAAGFLSVLKLKPQMEQDKDQDKDGDKARGKQTPGSTFVSLARSLEVCLWRWTAVADALMPCAAGPRAPGTWQFTGRLVQQMAACELPTPDVMTAMGTLLSRITNSVPSEDSHIIDVLHSVFQRFEYEPQLHKFVRSLLGLTDGGSEEVNKFVREFGEPQCEVHSRVVVVVKELLPRFRVLRSKVDPEAATALRSIAMQPTPQRPTAPDAELDGESLAASVPRSVCGSVASAGPGSVISGRDPMGSGQRSGTDAPSSTDSLFKHCFREAIGRPESPVTNLRLPALAGGDKD